MSVNLSCFLSEAQWDRLPEGADPDKDAQVDLGTFDYVQVTYGCIRGYRESGEEVAFYIEDEMWHPEVREQIGDGPWQACGPDASHHGWTDIVISEGVT